MGEIFRSYYVWPKFPSISMSGYGCELGCKHCNHKYLRDMQGVTKPEKLLEKCRHFADNGALGFLLSGGCNKNGEMLNLRKLLPVVKQIKRETDLIIKLHTGLVDVGLAQDMVSAGVDIASIEIVGSNQTIKEIFDFNATVDSYINTLQNLESTGMPYIVPHICIGLHYGELKGEFNALKIIKEFCNPSLLVMIVFRPTKGTVLENCKIPSTSDISTVIKKSKEMFPDKDISLGCIRPRTCFREEIELTALQAGVTRMEIPSKNTLKSAENMGYKIRKINACCALPEELEDQAIVE
ncbi:MAG: radical SAM protein [Petrotogales bacterium]